MKDLIKIFHPSLLEGYELRYYKNYQNRTDDKNESKRIYIWHSTVGPHSRIDGCESLVRFNQYPAGAVWNTLIGNEVEKNQLGFLLSGESRLPQAVTALLCGAALAASGLMLQTAFNNPLAGPSILGINSGASLGVALVMLAGGGSIATGVFTLSGFFSVILGAFIGSMVVMGLILFFSTLIKKQHHAADYGYHDRLYHFVRYFIT